MADTQTIANVLDEIQTIYSNWHPDTKEIKLWAEYLSEPDIENEFLVKAVKTFIKNSSSPFRPSLSEIMFLVRSIKEKETPIKVMDADDWRNKIKLY
jgi:hypothetical protein